MWRWYLNNDFQPFSYYLKILGKGWWDKDEDQPSGLHVEGRDENGKEYKRREGAMREGDREI